MQNNSYPQLKATESNYQKQGGLMFNFIKSFIRNRNSINYPVAPIEVPLDSTYNAISTLTRCVDVLVNSAAEIPLNVFEYNGSYYKNVDKKPKWSILLYRPSKEVDYFSFYKSIYTKLVFTGSALIYDAGDQLQLIPSFQYNPTTKVYTIAGIEYPNYQDFILVNLLHNENAPLAVPYIQRVDAEISLINTMLSFEKHYYKNKGIPGLILKTERPLSTKLKERILEEYDSFTSLMSGNTGKPYIVDSGMDIYELKNNFKDLEFRDSLRDLEKRVISNLGIPEILLHSGNNANINPNIKLFYLLTILPLVQSVASAFSLHFCDKLVIKPDVTTVQALKADFISESNAVKSLYTVGIISRNEARAKLQFEQLDEEPHFLEPANIAGSAVDPSITE